MFAKFNYSPSDYFYNKILNPYLTKGTDLYIKHEEEVKDCLSQYINENGIINGSDLKEHWFSISDKDIFISHSHKDINKVKAFAGWLYDTFGLEAFIDSCSWGYCDKLLKNIDNKYCYNPKSKTYDYDLRNYTTSHVHMMLSTALAEMLNKTERVIFFNTPNSISMSDELTKIKKSEATLSPWIYYELSMMTLIKSTQPRKIILEHSAYSDINIKYDVSKILKELTQINDSTLLDWRDKWNNRPIMCKEEALEILYEIIYPKSSKQMQNR